MAGSILGNRVLRKEDPKFLTSGGKYVEDLLDEPLLANAAYVTYVRSSVAHGKIVGIDTSAAAAMPGVLGIYTAADLGLTEEPATFNPAATRGRLAIGKVRFVGEQRISVLATPDAPIALPAGWPYDAITQIVAVRAGLAAAAPANQPATP